MPVVVIVGRPNVGKSTLFNVLVGERRSIVGPQRGVTRDRIWGTWRVRDDMAVDLVDTGGFDTTGEIELAGHVLRQTMLAIDEADLVVCLFDARQPLTPDDEELVRTLRIKGCKTVYTANKVDDPSLAGHAAAFCELGIDEPIAVSALNRVGIDALAHAVAQCLGDAAGRESGSETPGTRVSILGRPNVGKSMLLNRLARSERSLVSPMAGTTRDYVDTKVVHEGRTYTFVDTAGIRRKARIEDTLEFVSVTKALKTISRSDVCIVVVDATQGMTDQDKNLCGTVLEHGRPIVVAANKCDLLEEGRERDLRASLRRELSFAPDAPVVLVSALTGKGVPGLYAMVDDLHERASTRVPTAALNRFLADITARRSPPMAKTRPLKLYYITQVGQSPPRFHIVVNRPDDVPRYYIRFIVNALKKACGLEGVPVEVRFVARPGRKGSS